MINYSPNEKAQTDEQANSTRSSVREHPDQPQKDLPLGFVEASRGWGRVEQAVVKTYSINFLNLSNNEHIRD